MRKSHRRGVAALVALGIAAGMALLPVSTSTAGAVILDDAGSASQDLENAELLARKQTVVNGVGGSTARITLPVDVILDLRPAGSGKTFAGANIEGTGPAQGFVLADNVPAEEGGQYLYSWQLSDDYQGVVRRLGLGTFEQPDQDRFRIPAGVYSLYLISDGSPVKLTLEFDELLGVTTFATSRTVPLDFQILRNRAPGGTLQDNVYSVGQKAWFESAGLQAMTLATRTPGGQSESRSGFCYYKGAVSNEDISYLPDCPSETLDGVETESRSSELVDGTAFVQAFAAKTSTAGERAMGYWRWTTKQDEQMSALGYVLQYDTEFVTAEG